MVPKFITSTVFERNYDSDKRIIINRGGTRSTKTYSLAQLFIFYLFTDNGGVNSIVRKTFPALKATVMRDVIEILHEHDLYKFVDHNKTDHIITYKTNMIEFFSADDEQKVRGRKRKRLWCNEANELNYKKEFYQMLLRTTHQTYIDFNPDDENVWINTEIEQKRFFDKGDVEVIVSNYKDNAFLSDEQVAEIEYLQRTDDSFWKIFGLGEYGKISGLIFNNYKLIDKMPEAAKIIGYGIDFGFTNDPTAMYEVARLDGEIYINELIYETGLTNPDISTKMSNAGVLKNIEIIADSADPKSIQELYNMGWNVKPASKGPDSIVNGIDVLKRYNMNVTAKSTGLITELRRYKWADDKNGNPLNIPIDKYNHGIDAIRYLALSKLNVNNSGKYSLV